MGNVHQKPSFMKKRIREKQKLGVMLMKTVIDEKEDSGKVEVMGNVHQKPSFMKKRIQEKQKLGEMLMKNRD